jgi:hypothetical protein
VLLALMLIRGRVHLLLMPRIELRALVRHPRLEIRALALMSRHEIRICDMRCRRLLARSPQRQG